MEPEAVEQAIAEYEALRREALREEDADPGLEAVRAAVFLEDVLGVRVTDEDITGDLAEHPPALRRVVGRVLPGVAGASRSVG
jgi:hypothetical protein